MLGFFSFQLIFFIECSTFWATHRFLRMWEISGSCRAEPLMFFWKCPSSKDFWGEWWVGLVFTRCRLNTTGMHALQGRQNTRCGKCYTLLQMRSPVSQFARCDWRFTWRVDLAFVVWWCLDMCFTRWQPKTTYLAGRAWWLWCWLAFRSSLSSLDCSENMWDAFF